MDCGSDVQGVAGCVPLQIWDEMIRKQTCMSHACQQDQAMLVKPPVPALGVGKIEINISILPLGPLRPLSHIPLQPGPGLPISEGPALCHHLRDYSDSVLYRKENVLGFGL